jgi:hypothetical protein
MHAVLVTFHSTISPQDAEAALIDHLQAMSHATGLICATWMYAGARIGSYQVFSDRLAAERYLGGEFFQHVRRNTAFSDFEIRHFAIVDALSTVASVSQDEGLVGEP